MTMWATNLDSIMGKVEAYRVECGSESAVVIARDELAARKIAQHDAFPEDHTDMMTAHVIVWSRDVVRFEGTDEDNRNEHDACSKMLARQTCGFVAKIQ